MADTTEAYPDLVDTSAAVAPFFLTGEDGLRTIIYTAIAVTVNLEGRFLDPCGKIVPFVYAYVPTATDRSANTFLTKFTKGWILNVGARVTSGTPEIGQTFVQVRVVRGQEATQINLGTIFQGYVTTSVDAAYPNSPIRPSVDGPGLMNSVQQAAPAAGAEVIMTVPARTRWRPLAFSTQLTASGVAGNRETALVIDDGANIVARIPSNVTVIANGVVRVSFFHAAPRGAGAQDGSAIAPLPMTMLATGWRLRTLTTGILGGDQYSTSQLATEEWIEV